MLLTSARSSWSSRLSRVDLPALVSPTITTGRPFLITLPAANDCAKRVIMSRMW